MSKVVKATIGLMLATIIAKILGFCRELVLASSYGTSIYSDAYLVALNIPTVIFAAIGQSLTTTFIPLSCEIENKYGETRALKFTNNVLNIVIIVSIILSIVSMFFVEHIVKVFAIGFEGAVLEIAVFNTRILLLSLVFSGLSSVMTAVLQVKNKFFISGISTLPYNIVIIISILLSTKYGYNMLIWGTLIATSTMFLFQLPYAIKSGYKHTKYINLKDNYIKKMLYLLAPVFVGVFVSQFNVLVDKSLASTLEEGSISALNYANKLNGFVVSIFIVSIVSVIYPRLSQLANKDNDKLFKENIKKSINIIILLIIPITFGIISLSTHIVRVLFERNAFDSYATMMTSSALVCYSIGLIGIGLRDILNKVFYSIQDTKTPMINGMLSVGINIILNFILIKKLGYSGLALATSLSSIISIILLFSSLNKRLGYFGQDKILNTIFKSLVASTIMGLSTKTIYELLKKSLSHGVINDLLSLFISIIVGAIIYIILIYILKIEEIKLVRDIIRQNLKSKNKRSKTKLNNI